MIEEFQKIIALLKNGQEISLEQKCFITVFLEDCIEDKTSLDEHSFKQLKDALNHSIEELEAKDFAIASRTDERRNGKVLAFKAVLELLKD